MIKINNTAIATTLALAASSAGAATIGLWDGWDGTTDGSTFVETDSFGLVSVSPRVTEPNSGTGAFRDIDQTARGSNDGTFGTIAGAETATTGGLRLEKGYTGTAGAGTDELRTLWVSFVNDTAQTIAFDDLSFDAVYSVSGAFFSKDTYAVSFINQTTNVTTPGLGTGSFGTAPSAGDFADIDLDVSSITLPAGETGVFAIDFSGATSLSPGSHFDNLLVTGDLVDPVPEPSSAILVALAGIGLLRRRR